VERDEITETPIATEETRRLTKITEVLNREPEKARLVKDELVSIEKRLKKAEDVQISLEGVKAEAPELEFNPRISNVWNFSECDKRFGREGYPGRIPGQIIQNLLYYYTKEGDLIIDPMAGSGTTNDVCRFMNRRYLCYDIAPIRDDTIQHDIRKGFPEEAKGCDLVFLDPPYWRLQKGSYVEESTSEVTLEEWLDFMAKLAKDCYEVVRQGGYVTLLIQAFLDEKVTGRFLDLPFKCLRFFEEAGFKEVQRVSVPITSQVKSPRDVEYAKEKKIMLDLNRDLIIFKRE